MAAAFGASLAVPSAFVQRSRTNWRERRDLYPQGVASGDPHADSVLLWTRRPPMPGDEAKVLKLEVAEDADFRRVVVTADAPISADTDWTCRVLATGLRPAKVYWYRFTDERGGGSRVGRTVTAPNDSDERPVQFAFVSCQNVTQGACNAYRRMIYEDERRAPGEQLGFVLHLGDFVYEVVWYPEDRPQGYYDRKLRDVVRYPTGEKINDFHVPATVDDYRALYRGYLLDPDLQDARARWPFVYMWDNHEFSWKGWQSQQNFGGVRPAQRRKAAANQAWFEYQPARVTKVGDARVDRFEAPNVSNAPLQLFDEHGLGLEAGNIAAIESLKVFRTLRWGRNVELLLTDNRSFRSEPLTDRPEVAPFKPKGFPFVVAEDVVEILDAGRAYDGGQPPATIRYDGVDVPNPRRGAPSQSMLGATQKRWFLDRLRASSATWKVWGNSVAMLDWRTDFQNLPAELNVRWPTTGYALLGDEDWSGYRSERAEVLEFVKQHGITGFTNIAGDRHSFLAGLVSRSLPPKAFEPVGVEFVTGSVSAPGLAEAAKYALAKDHALRAVYLYQPASGGPVRASINMSIMHGVRSSLTLQRTGDVRQAIAQRNPDVAPHLAWADLGGHGYGVVRATGSSLEVEFVCIPAPLERSERADGGALTYRVRHRVSAWQAGQVPRIERVRLEGEGPVGV
jgi:alkaline phosphatase D